MVVNQSVHRPNEFLRTGGVFDFKKLDGCASQLKTFGKSPQTRAQLPKRFELIVGNQKHRTSCQ